MYHSVLRKGELDGGVDGKGLHVITSLEEECIIAC